MRIISGQFKGRKIQPPTNITARPTTDFAKEGLFNVLNNRIDFEEIIALDLFAGTGGISLELASRGCRAITAVEKNRLHCNFIRKISDELQVDAIQLVQSDVFGFLSTCKTKFDFIFADPPYDLPQLDMLPELVFKNELLKEGGLFILEHPMRKNFAEIPYFGEHRHYGNVNFSFFEI